jgi:Protein required for attachment to host cells
MTPTSLIIVADRGSLKAYRVDETPTRGPSLKLVQAFDVTDAHGRLVDKVTDQAGRFPVGDGGASGRHMNAIAERQTLSGEYDRRIYRQLADQITEILRREKTKGWSFAAPSEIYPHIVDLLPRRVREQIVEHVKSDLVKIESAKLPAHFRSLRPI